MVYTGTLYHGYRDLRLLLDAVQKLLEAKLIKESEISIDFYGTLNKVVDDIFNKHDCSHLISCFHTVPWKKCKLVQRSSAVLVLQTYPKAKGCITSKIFEYLAARRPILAIPNDHDCVQAMLKKTQAGVCCSTVDEISKQLLKWYNEWKTTGTIKCNSHLSVIRKYSRKAQAKQLANLLDKTMLRKINDNTLTLNKFNQE